MEQILFGLWFLLFLTMPVVFAATAYYRYMRDGKGAEAFGLWLAAISGYVVLTGLFIPFLFIIVFAGAHSNPVGQALTTEGLVLFLASILIYAAVGWLLCSMINKSLILPRFVKRKIKSNNGE